MPFPGGEVSFVHFISRRALRQRTGGAVDIHQPTLSQQLGVLRTEGVVNTRRQGENIYYSVADPATLEILAVLYRLYCPQGEI